MQEDHLAGMARHCIQGEVSDADGSITAATKWAGFATHRSAGHLCDVQKTVTYTGQFMSTVSSAGESLSGTVRNGKAEPEHAHICIIPVAFHPIFSMHACCKALLNMQ